ncbi:PREDICTED: transmembrane protein 119 [Elephantulus edwardii]|uniref:transmembrane protein 119 n=1 Tax=Elephantulus edwardii TaxID=28737 RepID=UPI0003F0B6B2|nr:PREDICTED: transmembrane protein 119 [Elephantulus edwardii]
MALAATPTLVSLLLLLSAGRAASHSVPVQAAFLEEAGGSGEAEGASASASSLAPPRTPALAPTALGVQPTALEGPPPPTNFLDGIMDFFRRYAMLIAVVGSLVFLLMFIVCAALITRQKHKASAYYPSSFPKKKYVDQSDRAGGPRTFCEVPERAPAERPEEALDSSQQLQADILAATQNLKSPAKVAPGGGDTARMTECKAEEVEEGTPEGALACSASLGTPELPQEPCSAGTQGAAVAEGQGESDVVLQSTQEAGDPAEPPESPCACSSATPEV